MDCPQNPVSTLKLRDLKNKQTSGLEKALKIKLLVAVTSCCQMGRLTPLSACFSLLLSLSPLPSTEPQSHATNPTSPSLLAMVSPGISVDQSNRLISPTRPIFIATKYIKSPHLSQLQPNSSSHLFTLPGSCPQPLQHIYPSQNLLVPHRPSTEPKPPNTALGVGIAHLLMNSEQHFAGILYSLKLYSSCLCFVPDSRKGLNITLSWNKSQINFHFPKDRFSPRQVVEICNSLLKRSSFTSGQYHVLSGCHHRSWKVAYS